MEQRQLFLRDILTVLFKRKLLIAFFTIVVFAVVFVGNQIWPPTYESSAQIRILRGREVTQPLPSAVQSSGGMALIQMGQEDINSEIELILSSDVLRNVVEELEMTGKSGLGALIESIKQTLMLSSPADATQEAIDELRESTAVTAVKNSHVLTIAVQRGSAQDAARIAESLITHYKAKHLEIFKPEQQSGQFFLDQIERVNLELDAAQARLNEFRNSSNIISIESEKLLLETQYRRAKSLIVDLGETQALDGEGALSPTEDRHIVTALSGQTESPVVTELQLKLLELVLRRNNLTLSLGPKHPELLAVTQEIRVAYTRLGEAIDTTKQVAQSKVSDIEARLQLLNVAEASLEKHKGQVTVLSKTLEFYTTKAEESLVSDKMTEQEISSIRTISAPTVPANPISPNKLLNLIIGLIAGIVGGVGIAFFLEYLDHGLKTPEDVEYYLGVPALASYFHGRTLDPAESQRLVTMIEAVAPEGKTQLIQIASATPGEDAQIVARALAEAHAENPEAATLLIDMEGDGKEGFVDVVLGTASLDQAFQNQGALAVLAGGSRKDCPTYLWASENMEKTIEQLRQQFDNIIFHTAPILRTHDAINLARFSDGALITAKADSTRREVVQRASNMIDGAAGNVLGVALTGRRQVIPRAVYRRI
jgi:uncharacterized protein involved in exopolysaccharide biosynthesis